MSDRSQIRVDELGYIYNYFRELSPAFLEFALLLRGIGFPAGPLHYLELGFGQGTSIVCHAAANDGVFWGNDHNPQHVAHAQALSAAARSNPTLLVDSFAQLLERDDLPEFNVITLHGIWTWVSEEDRHRIVEIARRRLARGGVLYVSYNSNAAWSALTPLRHLLMEHARNAPADVPLPQKAMNALLFAQSLVDAGALHFKYNPLVTRQIQAFREKDAVYLAHEFFGSDWQPMNFSDVVRDFARAGLTFSASGHVMEGIEAFSVPPTGRQILASIPDPILRETTREMFMNMHFREDIFTKEPIVLTRDAQERAFLTQRVALAMPLADVKFEVSVQTNQVNLDSAFFGPILAAIAADGALPKSISELRARGVFGDRPVSAIMDEITALVACLAINPVRRSEPTEEQRLRCAAMNKQIIDDTARGGKMRTLASAVTGGGISANYVDQLFIKACALGWRTPAEQAAFVWEQLSAIGNATSRDNKPLPGAEENIAELHRRAERFMADKLPLFEALGLVPAAW